LSALLNTLKIPVNGYEILKPLAVAARERLKTLGYETVKVKIGDGYKGWPEHQPFDAIIVTCAPDHIPPALIEQLKAGGRMVMPVGDAFGIQSMMLISKDEKGDIISKSLIPVRFVPMLRDTSEDTGRQY